MEKNKDFPRQQHNMFKVQEKKIGNILELYTIVKQDMKMEK